MKNNAGDTAVRRSLCLMLTGSNANSDGDICVLNMVDGTTTPTLRAVN
jgi:hypothetical protein